MKSNMTDDMIGAVSPELIQRNARIFWEGQNEFLDKMQTFANGWFQRRHDGTVAALQACESMCSAKSPAEWIAAYQQWMSGVWERTLADGFACQREFGVGPEGLSPPIAPPGAQDRGGEAQKKTARAAA